MERADLVVLKLFDSYVLWSQSNATVTDGPHDRDAMLRLLASMGWHAIDAAEAIAGAESRGCSVPYRSVVDAVQGNRAGPYGAELTLRELCDRYSMEPAVPPGGTFTFTLLVADSARHPDVVDDATLTRLRSIEGAAPGRTQYGQPAVTFSRDEPSGFITAVERAAADVEAEGLVVLHAVRESSPAAPGVIPLRAPSGGAR